MQHASGKGQQLARTQVTAGHAGTVLFVNNETMSGARTQMLDKKNCPLGQKNNSRDLFIQKERIPLSIKNLTKRTVALVRIRILLYAAESGA